MDWSLVVTFMLAGVFWMMIGMRLERSRRDAEVEAYEIPDEQLSDGAYWKRRYEDLVDEIPDGAFNQMDSEREAKKDARGKTT